MKKQAFTPPSFFRTLFIIGLFALLPQLTWGQTKYVREFRSYADSLSEEYGIPASVMLGVAILESGSGTSRNARILNNHFGIVGKNKITTFRSRYKQYDNPRDSYKDFCKLVKKKKFYEKLKGNTNYALWVDALSKAGYSEVPDTWKQRVLSTIKKNKLASP
jgi:flagellum-specific peptidoglycan hydrolase FlgJ